MKKLAISVVLLFGAGVSESWSQQYLQNQYAAKQYTVHTLMWDMIEDSAGYLWFGNNDGMVRFDGNNWVTFPTPNPVRNMVMSKKSELFVACLEDFGVIRFTPEGGTSYTSFRSQIDKKLHVTSGEENVVMVNDDIYFSTGNAIVKVTDDNGAYKLAIVDREKTLGFGVLQQKLLVNHAREGLGWLVNGRFTGVANGFKLAGKQIVRMLSFGSVDYIFTSYDGVYLLKNNSVTEFSGGEFNSVAAKGIVDAVVVNAQLLAVATYHNGVTLFDASMREQLKPELPSGEIYQVGADHEQNLWVSHHRGLTQVLTGVPVRSFQYPAISGNINGICEVNGVVYLSTTNGLFTTASASPVKPEPVPGVNHESWDIKRYNGELYVATTNGLYAIDGKKTVLKIPNETFLKLQTGNRSGNLYAFGVNSFYIINSQGAINHSVKVSAGSVYENKDGSIWIGTNHHGLQKEVSSTVSQKDIPEELLTGEVMIAGKNGLPVFQTKKGVYTHDGKQFVRDDELTESLAGNKIPGLEINKVTWFYTDKEWKFLADGMPEQVNVAYILNGKPTAYFHGKRTDWFASEDKIYQVEHFLPKGDRLTATISQVLFGQSRIVFNGVQMPEGSGVSGAQEIIPEAGNEVQTITVWFGQRSYVNPAKHRYRYRISGLTDHWSEWTADSKVALTGLSGGTYTLELEARDAFGNTATPFTYTFYVKPPWYLSGLAYMGYITGMITLLYGMVLLYNRRLVARNKKLEKRVEERTVELKDEKEKSDKLLLNILPAGVAEELKNKGSAAAKQYNNVTVLFTDMVNFTGISEQMTPKELVAEIHKNFTAFDDIIGEFGLEKIKTIGDAYLAVCGLPDEKADHATRVVRAALAIQQYIEQNNGRFQIRIGVHSGSVVAGIVGTRKYAYDIWGDTVNTAARMEQTSVAGKINISAATYELVKSEFTFTYRGKIQAKNKGEVDMYFVDGQ